MLVGGSTGVDAVRASGGHRCQRQAGRRLRGWFGWFEDRHGEAMRRGGRQVEVGRRAALDTNGRSQTRRSKVSGKGPARLNGIVEAKFDRRVSQRASGMREALYWHPPWPPYLNGRRKKRWQVRC